MAMAERLDRGERERQAAHIAFESMETFLKVLVAPAINKRPQRADKQVTFFRGLSIYQIH